MTAGKRGSGVKENGKKGCFGGYGPGNSVLDSEDYGQMDLNSRLSAVFREVEKLHRFHMEDRESQGRILHMLLENGPMDQRELTAHMRIRPGSASEVLKKLEKAGLIDRTVSQTDRRGMRIALTEAGRARAALHVREREARKAAQFSALSEEEKRTLLTLLEILDRDWQDRAGKQKPESAVP